MIKNQRILAVVPARGGSKGLPLKNIRPIHGVPLVALAGRVLAQLPEIDRRVVSTDHEEIARIAREAGLADDFRRPEALSGDRIGDLDVLTHALTATEALDGVRYDIVLMVQPTSPMRTADHVRQTVTKLIDEGLDSVWSVSETNRNFHPLKQLTLDDGTLDYYDARGGEVISRQQLTPVYHRNGASYAFTRECLLEQRSILGTKAGAVVLEPLVDIDTAEDLALAEYYLDPQKLP